MMKRKGIISGLLFLIVFSSNAQYFRNRVYNRKAAYLEAMGNGVYYSLNFEYLFRDAGIKQGIRGGPSYFINFFSPNKPTVITGNLEYVAWGFGTNHHIEAGLGITYKHESYKESLQEIRATIINNDTLISYISHTLKYTTSGPAIVPRIGYRYEHPDGGFVLRVGYTPLFYVLNRKKEFYDDSVISKSTVPLSMKFLWGGVSIGFSFY